MLSLITWAPLAGAVVVLLLPKDNLKAIRAVGLAAAGVSLAASLALIPRFSLGTPAMQFVEKAAWIPSLNVSYFLGVDGLSFPLILLTTLMTVIALIASLGIEERVKEYFFWFPCSRSACWACSPRWTWSSSTCSGS
jgi:NADH-quinone oxidoreductase subunit M